MSRFLVALSAIAALVLSPLSPEACGQSPIEANNAAPLAEYPDAETPSDVAIPMIPADSVGSDDVILPEIVVEAEQPAAPSEPLATPGTLTTSPYDVPTTFPNLTELKFDGLDSAARSSESLFDLPRAASIISTPDLTERQPRTMIEAMEREVGVTMQRTGAGQASPFVRGLTGPQTLILIDGVRMNNSTFRYGPNQYFALIDPGTIDQIEVLRGPQSVLWGSGAIGGVINIKTKSVGPSCSYTRGGEFIERFATADVSSYSRMSVEASTTSVGMIGGASYLNSNNLMRGGSLGVQPFTDFSQYSGDAKLRYALSPDHVLTFAIQHFEQMNTPRSDKYKPGSDERRFRPQFRDLGYIRLDGNISGLLFDRYSMTASYQRQEENQWREREDKGRIERGFFDVDTTSFNLIFNKRIRFARLTYGADWSHDEVDATKYYLDYNTQAFDQSVQAQFPNDSYYERFGIFMNMDVDLTDRLTASTGVRYSNIDSGGTITAIDDPSSPNPQFVTETIRPQFGDWSASVALSYCLAKDLELVGSVSEGFRAPGLDNLMTVSDNINQDGIDIPNPSLRTEKAIGYEVGLKGTYDRLRFQTFLFWTTINDMIVRDQVGQMNIGGDLINLYQHTNTDAAMSGYELQAELLVNPCWSVYGNMTYIYGWNSSFTAPMSRIPPLQGILGCRYRTKDMKSWFDVYTWMVNKQDHLSARDKDDSRIPAGGTPGFMTLNLTMGRTFCERHRVSFLLENITDKAYRVHGSGVDGPGFSGHLNYELRF